MSQSGFKTLWDGLREVVDSLAKARYWTQRRDSCEYLLKVAREIVYRLHLAAADKDPDISHWGNQAREQLKKDLALDAPALKTMIGDFLATPPAPDSSSEASPAPAVQPAPAPELSSAKAQPPAMTDEILISWLKDFAGQMRGTYQDRPKGASVTLAVNGDRKQTVIVDLSRADSKGRKMALFYSICGQAQADTYQWALESNCGLTRGAFGIIKSKDKDVLIILMRRPLEELVLDRLGRKLRYIATKADEAEARLKTRDVF